jgi:hypothetical protein
MPKRDVDSAKSSLPQAFARIFLNADKHREAMPLPGDHE